MIPYLPLPSFLVIFGLLVAGCTAPRAIINSGKVTAHRQFKAGANFGGNIASEPISQLDDITRSAVDAIRNKDSIYYDEQIDIFAKGLTAYALDPVGPTFDFYVRYGLVPRVDVGYKFASGAHVIDAMYQFLGPTGTPENPGTGNFYGSIGLQYSGQKADLPGRAFLNKIDPILGFTASRQDLVVPLIFSTSFGPEEEIGNISWGVVYNRSFVKYGFEPSKIFQKYTDRVTRIEGVSERNSFSAYGAFINGKIGYRYVYFLPALTIYYQNYGTYKVLGGKEHKFSGMTFIPSIGFQVNLGSNLSGSRRRR
ncbi:MAG: hypothetical protein AVDCRST_MAG95-1938 [uncultured Adhaeribacter sp.]|uniref:Uncharacterized protein n=1 Tax=uncultured Adhaeribacter sp. TaxID=448109 RepID=A0A6J4IJX0_9BACT|nr:MAG: hypothetical protein AVDCRST_MAG95-1938 [uncultured Adhaeribacter sp.]